MQIWIYFISGAGGDGFANLLEWADNVETLDSDRAFKLWRVQHWVDGSPKFWSPNVDSDVLRCFRNALPFKLSNNYLKRNYIKIVNSGVNTICTSHDIRFTALDQSDLQDTLKQNQVRVLLAHDDYVHANHMARVKNLISDTVGSNPLKDPIDHNQFDYVLNINEVQQDWSIVEQFCQQVGLHLDKKYYDEYCQIQRGTGELLSYSRNYRPKKYATSTQDGTTKYIEIK
jgi:hypothetical protein